MRKKKVFLWGITLSFLLASTTVVVAQMNGSYTVGDGGDYTTISDAIVDINSQGLSGHITLTISAGTYTERIDLSNLNNGAFTVTLEGEAKQSTIISPPDQDGALIKAGIVMQATHNVTLRNLTYNMSEISDNPSISPQNIYGIYIEEATNITLEESIVINSTLVVDDEYEISSSIYLYNTNNVILSGNQFEGALYHIEFDYFTDLTISGNTFENASTHIRYFQGELSGGNRTPGNNLAVENNTFTGGFNGIQTSAGSDPSPSNLTMENNEFNYQTANAIRIASYEVADIVGNTITSDISGTNPMQISFLSGSEISNNVIETSEGGGGIYLYRSDDVQIYNNIVSSKGFPLELADMTNSEVIHNTFHTNGNNALRLTVAWIYLGSENLTLKNNIFSGPAMEVGDEENVAIEFLGNHVNLEQDHNLFDADLDIVVYGASNQTFINGTSIFHEDYDLSELDAWSNHVSQDVHSQSLNPVFVDETDFRIDNGDFRFGKFLSEYPTDIDGETRIEGSVDVGADQYCVSIEVSEAVSSCETYEFDGLTLTESGEYFGEFVAINGCDSLVTLNLTILEPNSGSDEVTAEGSYDWNGTIYSESGTYEQTLTNQAGCDSVATLSLTIEPYFLQGSFVIGSSDNADFENFTEAVTDLQFATLTGDVEYFVESGTYNDTLKVSGINSNDFSITFIGEDKATTILHPLDSIDASSSGILIEGTDHVTIQNLTLEMDDISDVEVLLSSNDTKGISVVNADNITLDNLSLRNDSEVNDYSSNQFLISSGLSITQVDDLTISNSSFSGSGSHITLIEEHSNVSILENTFQTASEIIRNDLGLTGNNLLIAHNNFNGPFERAIYLYELEDVSILSNVIDGVDQTKSLEGIYLDLTNGSSITGNIVTNIETGIYFRESNDGEISRNKVFTTSDRSLYLRDMQDLSVINNFLGDLVFVRESIVLDFVNNTVVVSSDRDQAVLVEYPSSLSGVTHSFVNNIIVGGDQVETLVEIVGLTDPAVLTMNYNLYYLDDESGSKPLFSSEVEVGDESVVTPYATLTAWRDAFSFDQYSQSFEPTFTDIDDFHISSSSDYRFGSFLSDYTLDIDGHLRTESAGVDVGADQNCDPCTIIWDGAWSNAVGPSESENAWVKADYETIEYGTIQSNDLTLESGSTITVDGEASLVVHGELSNEGSVIVKSGSQLVTYGSVSGTDYQIERSVTGSGGYSIIGSPVQDVIVGNMAADYVYSFDGDVYENAETSEVMAAGKGYFAGFDVEDPTVVFNGTPNAGNQSYSLPTADKFHLIANPYAAAISHSKLINENSTSFDGTIYLWDDGGSNTGGTRDGGYVTVNAEGLATGTGGLQGKDAFNGNIGSSQGFFVYADEATSIDFTPSMQSTDVNANSDGAFYRNNGPQYIRLSLSNADFADDLIVMFHERATEEFDAGLDARKLKNANLSFYSTREAEGLAIQALSNEPVKERVIPLEVELTVSGEFVMDIGELNSLQPRLEILLEDVETGSLYNLRTHDRINIALNVARSEGRFNLILRDSQVLSFNDTKPKLWVDGSSNSLKIYYAAASDKEMVMIYDLSGKVVFREYVPFQSGTAVIDKPMEEGAIYVIRVEGAISKFSSSIKN